MATREAPPEPLVAHVEYTWTQHHAEVEVRVALGATVRKHEVAVTVRPWLLSVEVAGRGVVLRGSLHRAVVSAECVWVRVRVRVRVSPNPNPNQAVRARAPYVAPPVL